MNEKATGERWEEVSSSDSITSIEDIKVCFMFLGLCLYTLSPVDSIQQACLLQIFIFKQKAFSHWLYRLK